MPTRIDHVIIAARDLSALEAAFTRLGFSVTGGGTHPHLGTRNRIVVLGEGYVELLAVADPDTASPLLTRRLAGAEAGWAGFAVQSADIAGESRAMRLRGEDARGPHPGQLVAPSGLSRSWRVTMIGGDDLWGAAEPLPFLIQHDATGEQHRRELAGEGTLVPHANGAVSLGAVYVAVQDLDSAAASFARAYGLPPSRGLPSGAAYLGAEAREIRLDGSGERVVLARPSSDGPAQRRLDAAGEGVCAVGVRVADLAATQAFLDDHGIGYTLSGGDLWVSEQDDLGVPLAFTTA